MRMNRYIYIYIYVWIYTQANGWNMRTHLQFKSYAYQNGFDALHKKIFLHSFLFISDRFFLFHWNYIRCYVAIVRRWWWCCFWKTEMSTVLFKCETKEASTRCTGKAKPDLNHKQNGANGISNSFHFAVFL